MAATERKLDTVDMQWDRRVALGVVMAAHGYPMSPRKGDVITGLPLVVEHDERAHFEEAVVFHAGTEHDSGKTVTSGGRVLCVTALADSVKAAQQKVYVVAQAIHFDGAQYRNDIGYRALKS